MLILFPLGLLLGIFAQTAIIPAAFGIFLVIAAFFVGNAHQRNVAAKLFGFLVLVFVSALLGVSASDAFLDNNFHSGTWGVGVDVRFIVCEIAVLLTFLATLHTVVVIFCRRQPPAAKLFGYLVLVFVSALLGVSTSHAFLDYNYYVWFIVRGIAVLLTFLATLHFCRHPPDGTEEEENNDD